VIVAFQDLLGLRPAHVRLGDAPLELEDPLGLVIRAGYVREREHRGDVRLVLATDVRHLL